MGLEGDTVVQELVDIILMEDRSASSKTVCSLLCLVIQFYSFFIILEGGAEG